MNKRLGSAVVVAGLLALFPRIHALSYKNKSTNRAQLVHDVAKKVTHNATTIFRLDGRLQRMLMQHVSTQGHILSTDTDHLSDKEFERLLSDRLQMFVDWQVLDLVHTSGAANLRRKLGATSPPPDLPADVGEQDAYAVLFTVGSILSQFADVDTIPPENLKEAWKKQADQVQVTVKNKRSQARLFMKKPLSPTSNQEFFDAVNAYKQLVVVDLPSLIMAGSQLPKRSQEERTNANMSADERLDLITESVVSALSVQMSSAQTAEALVKKRINSQLHKLNKGKDDDIEQSLRPTMNIMLLDGNLSNRLGKPIETYLSRPRTGEEFAVDQIRLSLENAKVPASLVPALEAMLLQRFGKRLSALWQGMLRYETHPTSMPVSLEKVDEWLELEVVREQLQQHILQQAMGAN